MAIVQKRLFPRPNNTLCLFFLIEASYWNSYLYINRKRSLLHWAFQNNLSIILANIQWEKWNKEFDQNGLLLKEILTCQFEKEIVHHRRLFSDLMASFIELRSARNLESSYQFSWNWCHLIPSIHFCSSLIFLIIVFPFSGRKGYMVVKKCLKFVCLSVRSNQKRAFLFFIILAF